MTSSRPTYKEYNDNQYKQKDIGNKRKYLFWSVIIVFDSPLEIDKMTLIYVRVFTSNNKY